LKRYTVGNDYSIGKEGYQMIRVLLVDEHPMVRRGLRMRLGLEPDVEIVGEARNGQEALAQVQYLAPDVIVLGLVALDRDGIATTGQLRGLAPDTQVVILGLHDNSVARTKARGAGAAAFVEKRAGAEDLLVEIRRSAGSVH
jgi:DNA-binding NarL/FixJ family response regulator